MKPDHLRALTFLANHPGGCTETLMLARGFGPAIVAMLIKAGLVRAKTGRVRTGHGRVEVTRMRITDAGRAALRPTTSQSIAAGLTATERVLLFCVGTDTDWRKVITVKRGATALEETRKATALRVQKHARSHPRRALATARQNVEKSGSSAPQIADNTGCNYDPAAPHDAGEPLEMTRRRAILFQIAEALGLAQSKFGTQHMIIRGLIGREGAADRFRLTDQGRAVLDVLMMRATTRPNA